MNALLELASRAPSLQNRQPWALALRGERQVEVSLERCPELDAVDPTGRQRALSLGTFVGTARVAARCLGVRLEVEWSAGTARLAAAGRAAKVPGLERTLYERTTHRGLYDAAPFAAAPHLSSAVQVLHRPLEPAAELLAAATERLALVSPDAAPGQSPRELAEHRRACVRSASALLLFCTPGDALTDWLEAGERLAARWLELEAEGWVAQPLTVGVEDAAARDALRALAGASGFLQAVLRVGRTARREVPTLRRRIAPATKRPSPSPPP